MLRLFGDPELEQFARGAARALAERVPPESVEAEGADKKARAKAEQRLTRALSELFLSAKKYCRDHRTGVLKRARLTKIVQDELVKLGYGKEFVKEVTMALAKQVTQPAG